MRYFYDGMGYAVSLVASGAAWTASFFSTASSTPHEKTDEKVLNVCAVDLRDEKYLQSICEMKFLTGGYSKVAFNNIDFRQTPFSMILKKLCPQFIFVQAEFSFDQVVMMLEQGYDFRHSIYRVRDPISFEQYVPIYQSLSKKGLQNALHGVAVDFSKTDLSGYPDDIASACYPDSLAGAKVSQIQLHAMLHANYRGKPLMLNQLSLGGLDLSELMRIFHQRTTFSSEDLLLGDRKICLKETKIKDAIFTVETLAFIADKVKYHDWFQAEESFVLRCEVGLREKDYVLFPQELLKNIEKKLSNSTTARKLTPAMFTKKLPERLKELLGKEKKVYPQIPNASNMSLGEQLGWVFYFVQNLPKSEIAQTCWQCVESSALEKRSSTTLAA